MMKRLLLGSALALAVFSANAADLSLDGFLRGQCGTATATSGAATLNNKCGVITTESITAPSSSIYTLTLTNSTIAATDIVLFSVSNGTNTTGLVQAAITTPAAGSATISFRQANATNFNGTMLINYFVLKP